MMISILQVFMLFQPSIVHLKSSRRKFPPMCRPTKKSRLLRSKYHRFTSASDAREYIKEQGILIVIKADGLAAGKEVVIAQTLEEAYDAVDIMLVKDTFSSVENFIIIKKFLEGEEASFFALIDGKNALPLVSAQNHKHVGEGDTGPNIGEMGAYSPAPILTKEAKELVMKSIIYPIVKGMEIEGHQFVGVLYVGLIINSKTGLPKLLEYNVRFGNPECQVLLASCKEQLEGLSLDWLDDSALVVVLASKGYLGAYSEGTIIRNLDNAELISPKIKIFYVGITVDSSGIIVSIGERVLGVTATGKDIAEAQSRAYLVVDEINWFEGFCRKDIGWGAISRFPSSR